MSLSLGGHQQALFDAVATVGKPIVSIIFSGRPLVLPEVWKESAALLYAWQSGCQAGVGRSSVWRRFAQCTAEHVGALRCWTGTDLLQSLSHRASE